MIYGITDLHLTDNPLDNYRHEFVSKHFPEMANKNRPDGFLILGDLTEEKDRHSAKLVNKVVRALDRLAYIAPVVVLMGNHDYHDEGHPFFEFLNHVQNIAFIDSVTDGQELGKTFAPFYDYLFLPHTRDYKRDWDGFLTKPKRFEEYDCVFAHNTFDGADTGYGRKLDGIPADVFGKAKVLAGDIHNPQRIGPVEYIGAPYTVDFGDDYDPRVAQLDGGRVGFASVARFPQKRLIHIAPGKDLRDYAKGFNEGDILKVRVDVETMEAWGAIVKLVQKMASDLGANAVRVEPVIERRAKPKKVSKAGNESAISDKEILHNFADRNRLDDATLETGLDLLEGET